MRNYRFLLSLLCVLALVLPLAVSAQDATPEAMMDEMVIGQDMMSACPTPSNLPDTVNSARSSR